MLAGESLFYCYTCISFIFISCSFICQQKRSFAHAALMCSTTATGWQTVRLMPRGESPKAAASSIREGGKPRVSWRTVNITSHSAWCQTSRVLYCHLQAEDPNPSFPWQLHVWTPCQSSCSPWQRGSELGSDSYLLPSITIWAQGWCVFRDRNKSITGRATGSPAAPAETTKGSVILWHSPSMMCTGPSPVRGG